MKRALCCLVVLVAAGCATAPKPVTAPQTLHGVASWYGQEFAGRTTANGEIFDPMLFTAAHRTLPFGTVCDVTNPKNGQSVRVRINDRGPYIGGRMIDLSYAAAQQIGLIEPGSGEVDVKIVRLGSGHEAPAPLVVTVPDIKPIPAKGDTPPSSIPVVVDNVAVVEDHHGVETRLQVSNDGKKIEEVPVNGAPASAGPTASSGPTASAAPSGSAAAAAIVPAKAGAPSMSAKFFVQVGAFAQEANAKELLAQLAQIGEEAHIDGGHLYKVRLGPFETRDQAIAARGRLESAGMSAIVLAQ